MKSFVSKYSVLNMANGDFSKLEDLICCVSRTSREGHIEVAAINRFMPPYDNKGICAIMKAFNFLRRRQYVTSFKQENCINMYLRSSNARRPSIQIISVDGIARRVLKRPTRSSEVSQTHRVTYTRRNKA